MMMVLLVGGLMDGEEDANHVDGDEDENDDDGGNDDYFEEAS